MSSEERALAQVTADGALEVGYEMDFFFCFCSLFGNIGELFKIVELIILFDTEQL